MKYIKFVSVVVFSLMILLPLARFRFDEGVVSEIDNRKLQENPFCEEERAKKGGMKNKLEAYVNDRIGFRDSMILAYMLLNDRVFGEMVHRGYCYGKDGYVFFRGMNTPIYGTYHEIFADMVKHLQDYCETRGVPFLFVFEPQKNDILPQFLPAGVHYDNRWVTEFFRALDKRGIHYVNNTVTLRSKTAEGEAVFNPKYDAGHWNDVGRFYGVNAMLSELHKNFVGIKPNNIETFEQSEALKTTLPISYFPIHEYVPDIKVPLDGVKDFSGMYKDELERHKNHPAFSYTINPVHANNSPRTLFFQGSHLNGSGSKFLAYALGEYIYIHNYQNVIDLPYYFNIFRPECVVFEVAEYVLLGEGYFDEKKMKRIHYNPPLKYAIENKRNIEGQKLLLDNISVQEGKTLTKILLHNVPKNIEYVWCLLGDEFDMRPSAEGGYEVTVKKEVWQKHQNEMQIVTMEKGKLQIYMR